MRERESHAYLKEEVSGKSTQQTRVEAGANTAGLRNGKESNEAGKKSSKKGVKNRIREGREGVNDHVRCIFCVLHRLEFLLGR